MRTAHILRARIALAALLAAPLIAHAGAPLKLPDCPGGNLPPRVLHNQLGQVLESVAAEPPSATHNGRLYFSDIGGNRYLEMDSPDQAPKDLLTGVTAPGGLLWLAREHKLLAGTGNFPIAPPPAQIGVIKIDPSASPATAELVANNLDGSNGVARAPDGTIFVSDSVGGNIDKISSGGEVTKGWAKVPFANGMVVDAASRYLYVNQTISTGTIARVEIANPANTQTFFQMPLLDAAAFLDGLTIDAAGRLYANAYGGAAVYRISPNGSGCALAHDPRLLGGSMSAIGGGGNFPSNNLYVSTHLGLIIELPNAVR